MTKICVGAAGQRERVAELVMMAREQGREVQIIAADRRSQMNLKQDERLSGELITGRRQLLEGMAFTPGSTVIVDQGEKLSLKETLTLLDGAARHNVQVLITDSGQRTGTGSALMAMKDAGVNTWRIRFIPVMVSCSVTEYASSASSLTEYSSRHVLTRYRPSLFTHRALVLQACTALPGHNGQRRAILCQNTDGIAVTGRPGDTFLRMYGHPVLFHDVTTECPD